jgi:hypothetical protein
MDEARTRIEFREIDEHGNPVDHQGTSEAPQGRVAVNPFIIGLWVLELMWILVSVWLINEALNPFNVGAAGTVPRSYLFLNFAPPFVLAAALVLAALLFWHARQWQIKKVQN